MRTQRRTLIFIPTYNEADNVQALYRQIERLGLGCDFLFLDDNSPDGTGEIIDRLADENPRVRCTGRENSASAAPTLMASTGLTLRDTKCW
jgi:dolichol-phosphate mannosyltransferase